MMQCPHTGRKGVSCSSIQGLAYWYCADCGARLFEISFEEVEKLRTVTTALQEGPHPPDLRKVVVGFQLVMDGLGLDQTLPHFKHTAARAARAWYHELCGGLTNGPPEITTFPSAQKQMVILKDIPIKSLCAHHLLPFLGTAVVGYIPGGGEILGLSKLSRIADYWSRRPQVQEELTEQIADAVAAVVVHQDAEGVQRGGVGVVIRANHMCMQVRGVNHSGNMLTSALRGEFISNAEARAEFLQLARTYD